MVRLLEAKDLIRRERCDVDGRARRVHLTKAGRQLQRKLSSSFALFGEEIGIGEKRPTVQNLENSTTSSQKHGGRRWNLLKLSWHC